MKSGSLMKETVTMRWRKKIADEHHGVDVDVMNSNTGSGYVFGVMDRRPMSKRPLPTISVSN